MLVAFDKILRMFSRIFIGGNVFVDKYGLLGKLYAFADRCPASVIYYPCYLTGIISPISNIGIRPTERGWC